MSAFEYAWSVLKANPYQQAYIESIDHDSPRGFGEAAPVYQQPMGTIHPSILGLMRRNDPSGGVFMDHRIRVPGERRKGLIEDNLRANFGNFRTRYQSGQHAGRTWRG